MWRSLLTLFILSLGLYSCSHIGYNPETNMVSYWRLGNQELNGLKVIKTRDGEIKIYLEGQKATDEQLTEILRIVRQLVVVVP